MAHSLYVNKKFFIDNKEGQIQQLEGRFAYINQIDLLNKKENNNINKQLIINMNAREKEYKKFIFFKYLFNEGNPIIITEGKTDSLYIKAALKSLHKEFPSLVEKQSENNFIFHINFLKRTKRIKQLLDIGPDGAIEMQKIYKYFIGGNKSEVEKFPNYAKFFFDTTKHQGRKVILLFDNEFNDETSKEKQKNKPIEQFFKTFKKLESKKLLLKNKQFVKIEPTNLYILVPPLVNNKKQCEIEDLFKEDALNVKLNNRSLSLEQDYDINTQFGKHEFSLYVSKNYQRIDFSNFRELFRIIETIQKE